jgi:hypothetical protein
MPHIQRVDRERLTPGQLVALQRVERRMRDETRDRVMRGRLKLGLAQEPVVVRTFEDTPRENAQAQAGVEWIGERLAFRLQGSLVNDPDDGDNFRLDGSYAGVALGNWIVSANMLDRWWNPGWDGDLLLSNAARPIPALMIERNRSTPFKTPWLSWIGPWKINLFNGWTFDDDRPVEDPMLFGMRVDLKPLNDVALWGFKPLDGLEVGVARTAMWGGSGRPKDFKTFWKILIGKSSNVGEGGIDTPSDDFADQRVAYDFRYAPPWLGVNLGVYGQRMFEDEKDNELIRRIEQYGAEHWGEIGSHGARYRIHYEYADTVVDGDEFNDAYNNFVYPAGYTYKGRIIGYSTDNDSQARSLGFLFTDPRWKDWMVSVRNLKINRDGTGRHSVSDVARDSWSYEASHQRPLLNGRLHLGVRYELWDEDQTNRDGDIFRTFAQWERLF